MISAWRWAGACAIGTSHVKANLECQDRAACLTFETSSGPTIVAVVSDGAGSAREAAHGASIACTEFHRRAGAFLRGGGALAAIDAELAVDWIDSIRDRISAAAQLVTLRPRDYAATLVALIANGEQGVVVHIGDGAAVVRSRETREWSVPSWPFHGEYAATTRFITDDPQAQFEVVPIRSEIDRFALFSDGIENLVLDNRERIAPAPFFERLLQPVATWEGSGRSKKLSKHLRDFLGSERVCEATDDDKSLILGAGT
jgi:serine/threonine protein phosphatase PrpC